MRLLKEFEEKIGYHFQDEKLLEQALTHSSYANERYLGKLADNERLEFLGDAVLEIVSSDFLYHKFPKRQEGELTRTRASMVCESTLAFCTKELELGKYLMLGKGEEQTGGRERKSILSDALEAVIGAVYLDGGFANAKEFVLRFVLNDMEHKQLFFDSKTILQEYVQGNCGGDLSYRLLHEEGPDHDKKFLVQAWIGDRGYGKGSGRTKKNAEQEAAYETLMQLDIKKKK
ncbi:ribonuclease III [Lachnospiraceae bacterium 29-84]